MNIITPAAEMIKLAVTLSGVFEGITIVEFVLGILGTVVFIEFNLICQHL